MIKLNLPRNSCVYKLAGAETFRSSSAAIFGRGTNLQNIAKEQRAHYWADDGKIFVQVDQSGAEALIVAYLCEPGRFRDLFLNGVKPHIFVAMHVFLEKWKLLCKDIDVTDFALTPIPELKKKQGWQILKDLIAESDNWLPQERYYYIGKMICHAANYGMRGAAFQMNVLEKSCGQIALGREQADGYLMHYHSLFPEITGWHHWAEEFLKEHGCLYNLFGYPRTVTGKLDENDFKEWYAFSPQSTVGCITHIEIEQEQLFIDTTNRINTVQPIPKLPEPVIYCLDTYGSKPADWDILANTHDSSMTQAQIEDVMRCAQVKMHLMQQPLTSFRGEKFNMRAEAQAGSNWGPMKKEKNPHGLVTLNIQ